MSVYTVRHVYVSGLILAFASAAVAQDGDKLSDAPRTPFYGSGGSTLIYQLVKPGVQEELRLDESKAESLLDSLREIDPKHVAFRTQEEQQRISRLHQETTQKSEAAVQKFLSEEQFRRFEQLEMQYLGGRALLNAETAQRLELTAEQQERLKTIRAVFGTRAPGPGEEDASVRIEKYKSDLLAVLTPEQMQQWQTMTGAPFKIPKSFSGPSWRLALAPEVQMELGLSEEGAATLGHLLATIQSDGAKERSRADPDRAGRDPIDRMRQSQQIIDTVQFNLTAPQWNRLQELILQETGPESIVHHEVTKELGLSQEQKDRASEIIAEYRRSLMERIRQQPVPNVSRARQQKEQADLLDILTQDQRTRWEAMQGAKVDQLSLRRRRVSPAVN